MNKLLPSINLKLNQYQLLLFVMLAFGLISISNAQTAASATWALGSNGNATTSGSVTASAIAIGSGINTPVYSGTTGISTSSWANDAPSLQANEYYEYKITPVAGNTLFVNGLSGEHSRSSGNWIVAAYYSLDGFVTQTQIGTNFSINSSTSTSFSQTGLSYVVPSGVTFSVRIFAWESDGSNRNYRNRNIVISGITCPNVANVTQPSNQTLCAGGTISLTSSFNNASSYQWYQGGSPISGATSANYTRTNASTTNSGVYYVIASNSCGGTLQSNAVSVYVNPIPTSVSATASASQICPGSAINLTSSATFNSGSTTTVLSENFNGTAPGWTTINNSTNGTPSAAAWTLRPNNYNNGTTFSSNDASQFYLSDSDAQGSGSTTATILQSPAFSTLGLTSANLTFYHYYRFNSGTEAGLVQISTNGTSWTTLQTVNTTVGSSNSFQLSTLSLNSYLNESTVYIRFKYDATFDWYWAVDNVVVSGNLPSTSYAWSSTPSGYTSSVQNPTGIIPSVNTTYMVTATNSFGCSTTASTANVALGNSTTWNGSAWSNGSPNAFSSITFTGDYTINTDLTACSITVSNNANVTVASGTDVTLTGALSVSTGSTYTQENNANLLQDGSGYNNTGSISVKRNSSLLLRQDYTLWSSPTTGTQTLLNFSPSTLTNRFYEYNTTAGTIGQFVSVTPSTTVFDTNNDGKGYLIRLPNNHPSITPTAWQGTFNGVPNNGSVTVTMVNGGVGKRFNLVGNPYPSPISMSQFVSENSNITGTLYFWRETNGNASNNPYCTWNGGTFVGNGQAQVVNPNGIIRTGQGFFVEANGSGTSLVFNNSQRVSDNANQFFRIAEEEMSFNRIWLNLVQDNSVICQTAFGYNTNGTNELDQYDARAFDGEYATLSSLIEGGDYIIQSKALPFDSADVIPLSLKLLQSGSYTIAIDHVDGLFDSDQGIYLKDLTMNVIHDLKNAPYAFTSESGYFADRFQVVYQNQLSTDTPIFSENQVIVYPSPNNGLTIESGTQVMQSIKVYDVQGRLLEELTAINDTKAILTSLQKNIVMLLQITSVDGVTVVKKVIR